MENVVYLGKNRLNWAAARMHPAFLQAEVWIHFVKLLYT